MTPNPFISLVTVTSLLYFTKWIYSREKQFFSKKNLTLKNLKLKLR